MLRRHYLPVKRCRIEVTATAVILISPLKLPRVVETRPFAGDLKCSAEAGCIAEVDRCRDGEELEEIVSVRGAMTKRDRTNFIKITTRAEADHLPRVQLLRDLAAETLWESPSIPRSAQTRTHP